MSFIARIRTKSKKWVIIALIEVGWLLPEIKRWWNIKFKKSNRNCLNKLIKYLMEWKITKEWQLNLSTKKIRIWRPYSKL